MSSADFILLRPLTVTDAMVSSTNVPEVASAAIYNGGTTYALGVIVGTLYPDNISQAVYQSLQAGNVGHIQTSSPTYWRSLGTARAEYSGGQTYSSGDVVGTHTGHAQLLYQSLQNSNTGHTQASSPTWWEYVGVAYDFYDVTVTYAANDIVTVVTANSHLLYRSVVGSNTGGALTDITKWVEYSSTNAWACFDDTYGSQTMYGESITTVLAPGVVTNAAYLGNVAATSVRVQQSVSGYDQTFPLTRHDVSNWYDYWYEPIVQKSDLSILDIPPYPASTLTFTISNPGAIAKCGILMLGQSVILGKTSWDILAGILSYSGTTTDGFGNTTFVRRASAKKLNVNVKITPGFEDEAFRLLTTYSDMPIVVIASVDYQMAASYCCLGPWQVPLSDTGKLAPIELKGLT